MASLKNEIRSQFKLAGFQLRLDASRHLQTLLAPLADESGEAEQWIGRIIECLAKKNLDSGVINAQLITQAVQV